MIQVKLYQSAKLDINDKLGFVFGRNSLYFYSDDVVGIGFDPGNDKENNLKQITEKAYQVGLKPVILTGPKFMRLLETAIAYNKKIIEIKFDVEIDSDDEQELESLLSKNCSNSEILALVNDILESGNSFIKNISWFEEDDHPIKLSLFDSGILFVNDGYKGLDSSKCLVGSAVARG